MTNQDNDGLPRSYGSGFPQPSENGILVLSQDENVFASLGNDGIGHCLHSTLPPPPPVTLLTSRFPQVERYEATQALLVCKHQDGNFICIHVQKMKAYIDKLGKTVSFFKGYQAIDLVLLSLRNSYSQFIESFCMRNLDLTLSDLTEMLIVAEAEMLKNTSKIELLKGSNSKSSIDTDNDKVDDIEKLSLLYGKEPSKIKPFDRMVKRKFNYGIIPCSKPKESIFFLLPIEGTLVAKLPKIHEGSLRLGS
ncbi:hypothetical protein Lser_V15G16777 [Lactuca serriola]